MVERPFPPGEEPQPQVEAARIPMEPQYGPFEFIRKRARTPEEEEDLPLAQVRKRLLEQKEPKGKRRAVELQSEHPESEPQQPEGSGLREEEGQDLQTLLQEKGIILKDPKYVDEAESLRTAYEQLRSSWQELEAKYPQQYKTMIAAFNRQSDILTNLAANLGQYQYLFGDYVSLILAAFPVVSGRNEIVPEKVRKQVHLTKENLLANAMFVTHYLHDLWRQPVNFDRQADLSVQDVYYTLATIQKHILNNLVDNLNRNLAGYEKQRLARQLRQDNPNIFSQTIDKPHLLAIYPPNADPTQDPTLVTQEWLNQQVKNIIQTGEAEQPWNENPAQAN